MLPLIKTNPNVDILLLLEGTYPYVQGGVSNWVAQLLEAFPEYTFGAIFLGSKEEEYQGICFELPSNLRHLEAHFLFSAQSTPPAQEIAGNHSAFEKIANMHEWFKQTDFTACPHESLKDLKFYLDSQQGIDHRQFLYSQESWQYITQMYKQHSPHSSFLDYFWMVRNMHGPIWQLAKIAAKAPTAKIYHTISTGYAGFLASLLHHTNKQPMVLSEHGIYTKERRIDILQNPLWSQQINKLCPTDIDISYIQKRWISFFNSLGRFCYSSANSIISLFEKTRQKQIADGAPAEKTRVIANGINIPQYSKRRKSANAAPTSAPTLCLVGRVVPIKDIKTFIRAIRIIVNHIPKTHAWIVGPCSENKEYVEECRYLVEAMDLNNNIKFLGPQKTAEILPQIDLLLLSSISEGLPLVLLEAFAAGVPVVTTDVGACRQLVYGETSHDIALGNCGRVVGIANPKALANATLELLTNPSEWQRARKVAIERVEQFYSQERMFSQYRHIYQETLR